MATPKRFSVDNEKKKIVKLYMSLREILEATLKQMKANTDDLSASKIDVAVKAIRQLPGILLELEKIDEEQERKAQRQKDREEAMARLPAPGAGTKAELKAIDALAINDPDFPNTPPVAAESQPISLPFPLRGIN